MYQPKSYQYEIVIPIKLRIPIYCEPVVINTSSFSTPDSEALSTSPSQASSSITQILVPNSSSSTVDSNTQIQLTFVESELALAASSQSIYLSSAAVQTRLNLNLDKALYVLRSSEISFCPRPIWLLAAASISAVLVQVFLWSLSQTCPTVSHDSLLQAGLKAESPALLCAVSDDENITEIQPTG